MAQSNHKKRIAIFASGTGSNAQKMIDYFRGHVSIEVTLIVSNKPSAGVLEIARKEEIPFLVIERRTFMETGYTEALQKLEIDWIILAGFLWKVPPVLIAAFPLRIINIHPALLPAYGGKGMYGMAVHEAVILSADPKSGITIHFVDEHYDNGAIILQESVLLDEGETAESLAQKIHELEYRHFAPTIERIIMDEEKRT